MLWKRLLLLCKDQHLEVSAIHHTYLVIFHHSVPSLQSIDYEVDVLLNNIPLLAIETVLRQHWILPSIEWLEIDSRVFDGMRFLVPFGSVATEFPKEGLTTEMDVFSKGEAVVYGDTKKARLLDSS
tara:strand:+ start:168 stop:545 length:378 start_codon:yes stop_codon:yes gene_type:complete